MVTKNSAMVGIVSRATYFLERWKLGAGILLMVTLCAAAALLIAGASVFVVGMLIGIPSLPHASNIMPFAALVILPFLLSGSAFLSAVQALGRSQSLNDGTERQRRKRASHD